jgi:hypothetical protein
VEILSVSRLGLVAILGVTLVAGAKGQGNEYQVKAAFLYNFARFVEWPATSFSSPTAPIVICILGPNPFGQALDDAIHGKMLAGRPFAVRLISDLPPKYGCQILFVNSSDRKHFRSMVGSFKGGAILAVGDSPGFIDDGGIINFKLEGDKIRFEINVEAAEQAQLSISSKLLSLAQIVRK